MTRLDYMINCRAIETKSLWAVEWIFRNMCDMEVLQIDAHDEEALLLSAKVLLFCPQHRKKNMPTHKVSLLQQNFIFIATSFLILHQPCISSLFTKSIRRSFDLWNFIQFSEPTRMDPTASAPHPLPNRYIGTYLAKPVTGSISRSPVWNSFINTRIGPTTIGDLPQFLEEFYRVHVGNLDPKFEILTGALRECHQVTQSVFWFLEQGPVKDKSDKMFFLNRALLRNHELWYKVVDELQKCIKKSPGVVYLFLLGRRSTPFDAQHSGAAKIFLQKLVKRTIRDPRSWNLFRRSFLVDDIREYIITTNMLIRDIEDELEETTEAEPEPRHEARAWVQ